MPEIFKFSAPENTVDDLLRWARAFSRRHPLSHDDSLKLGLIVGGLQSADETVDALGNMLNQIAIIVKGEPEPGHTWGFEDLPELIQALVDKARAH